MFFNNVNLELLEIVVLLLLTGPEFFEALIIFFSLNVKLVSIFVMLFFECSNLIFVLDANSLIIVFRVLKCFLVMHFQLRVSFSMLLRKS